MAHSRPISVHRHTAPHGGIRPALNEVPWSTILLLVLVLIVILALWGKLPSRLNLPHEMWPLKTPASSFSLQSSFFS